MKLHRTVAVAFLCGCIAIATSCTSVAMNPWIGEEEGDPALIAYVDTQVRDLIRKNDIPGLSIAVVHDGSVLVLRGYGLADREQETPATPDTVFRAYSIAKVFTALETVRLAEDGLIALDDPIANLLPEWPDMDRWQASAPVTVRHLLSHRGGLPRNSNYHENLAVAGVDCLRLQVESLGDAWAAYPAEYRYKYSNVGSNVLGRLIELERSELYALYMTNEVLPAYGMDRSAYLISFLPEDAVVATGYEYDRGQCYAHPPYDIIGLASGNLYATAADFAEFMMLLLGSTPSGTDLPIDHGTLLSTYVPQFSRADDPERNGLGWMTSETMMGELMVWHQGGDYDANALVALLPQSNIGICVLTNSGSYEGVDLLSLAADTFRAVQGTGVTSTLPFVVAHAPSPSIAPLAGTSVQDDLERATGRYIAYGEVLELELSGDELRAQLGPVTLRLSLETENELGGVYSVRSWLDAVIPGGLFPVDLSLVRLIVPPSGGLETEHLIMAVSDLSYEFCPRYPEIAEVPENWLTIAGEYDGCTVVVEDQTMKMTGVGYLVERSTDLFEVLGGVYSGETVSRNSVTGSLFHQGFEYRRQ